MEPSPRRAVQNLNTFHAITVPDLYIPPPAADGTTRRPDHQSLANGCVAEDHKTKQQQQINKEAEFLPCYRSPAPDFVDPRASASRVLRRGRRNTGRSDERAAKQGAGEEFPSVEGGDLVSPRPETEKEEPTEGGLPAALILLPIYNEVPVKVKINYQIPYSSKKLIRWTK